MLKGAGLHRGHEDSLVCKIFFGTYKVEKIKNNASPGLVTQSLVKKKCVVTLEGRSCDTGVTARPMQNKI